MSLFLPIVGAPLLAAMQAHVGPLPSGFSIFDLARLQGVGSVSWHALIVLTMGGVAALMAFTGPHQGLKPALSTRPAVLGGPQRRSPRLSSS